MRNASFTEESYIPRKLEINSTEYKHSPYETKIVIRLDASQKYRIYDDFPDNDVVRNEDGSYTVTISFIEDEWVYGYILSFGSSATVLEPEHIKGIIKKRLKDSLKNYL